MPPGTVTVSEVAVAAVTVAAVPPEPPNLTVLDAAVVLKFVPVIVTDEPMSPFVGENDETVGADTVKLLPDVTVPFVFETKIVFDAAMPPGTVTVMVVVVAAVTVAAVPPEPPNLTVFCVSGAPARKLVPVTVTEEPMLPLVGAKLVMVGAAACATPAKTSVATRESRAAPVFRSLWVFTVTSMFLLARGG